MTESSFVYRDADNAWEFWAQRRILFTQVFG